MSEKKQDEKEVERRRDEALRRALSTPPKPHAPKGDGEKKDQERKA
ncbi:MAG TPA: hypothetical protein VMM59_02715 [Thermohalobaculum sp.]|nr:hypothetical protein [Thermohalobaculum sp.]